MLEIPRNTGTQRPTAKADDESVVRYIGEYRSGVRHVLEADNALLILAAKQDINDYNDSLKTELESHLEYLMELCEKYLELKENPHYDALTYRRCLRDGVPEGIPEERRKYYAEIMQNNTDWETGLDIYLQIYKTWEEDLLKSLNGLNTGLPQVSAIYEQVDEMIYLQDVCGKLTFGELYHLPRREALSRIRERLAATEKMIRLYAF
jgi:hypothetical protein